MFAILHALGMFVADLFKSRTRLEAENLFLRHQLDIALRRAPPRLRLHGSDRALLVWMTKLWPSLLGAAQVVQPETILRWHRAGFKVFCCWKSRNRAVAIGALMFSSPRLPSPHGSSHRKMLFAAPGTTCSVTRNLSRRNMR
jgi:hypothetical protein